MLSVFNYKDFAEGVAEDNVYLIETSKQWTSRY